jgi:multidrug efflux system membrane fusion protein
MSRVAQFIRTRALLLSTAAVIAIAGTGVALHSFSDVQAQPEAPAAAPATQVTAITVTPQPVRIWSEFSGRLQAVDAADIRPEVSGRITEVRFRDGQTVQAGDVLFVIDPRPYEAAVAKAEANLASAKTNARYAKAEVDRAASLVKTQAISTSVYDSRVNTDRVAQANIQGAEADLKDARLDLEHAYVKAPIAGRVSRAELTVGNLVQAGANAPLLTSIVSVDSIYADFDVDEATYIKSVRAHANTTEEERQIPVELRVQGDSGPAYKGTIYSFDNRINPASGTIRARARFANDDHTLVPGMFAAIRLASASEDKAILVPSRAIGNNQSKKFVYVAGDDNKVAYREVTLGKQVDGQRIVLSGLQGGDRVIVDGLQHVRPDMPVQVTSVVASNRSSDHDVANR